MNELLDELLETVYVADPVTYELKYMNATGLKTIGIEDFKGRKCYEVIQRRDKPCDFCTNTLLRDDRCYTWRHLNETTGKQYLLKDKLIQWEGKPARMEVAFDITEMEHREKRLQMVMQVEQTILECISSLHKSRDLAGVLDKTLRKIACDMGAERAYIFEIRGDVMNNTHEWCKEGIPPQIDFLQNLPFEPEHQWNTETSNVGTVAMPDMKLLREKHPDTYEDFAEQGIERLVAVPLELDGQLLGYIGVDNPSADMIDYVAPLLSTLGYFISSRIRREEDRRLLNTLNQYDPLTGAMNRSTFIADLERFAGDDTPIGIVCVDINGMKEINDLQGQPYGDRILIKLAEDLISLFGPGCLYRSGGDEFVVMQRDITYSEQSAHVRELRPYLTEQTDYYISVGFQWAKDCHNIKQILSDAEAMMYADKKQFYQGKAGTRYRHANDDVLGLTKTGVLEMMLADQNFIPYFQPKVAVEDGSLIGAEALVRLRGTGGNVVVPDQFIPLLEQAHFISLIDFYMFEQVCKILAEWHEKGLPLYPVSVNFSRYSLTESHFQAHLWDIWQKYSIPQKLIEIEVTESVEAVDGYDFLRVIEDIRSTGFAVSIDDFGIKHANLSLFTAIDFDALKVDKSLIWQLPDNSKARAIIQSVSDICKKMGIKMIAEGVETEEQWMMLQEMGCMGAQGYLFSKPLPKKEYERLYLYHR